MHGVAAELDCLADPVDLSCGGELVGENGNGHDHVDLGDRVIATKAGPFSDGDGQFGDLVIGETTTEQGNQRYGPGRGARPTGNEPEYPSGSPHGVIVIGGTDADAAGK